MHHARNSSSMVFVNNLSCFNVSFECEPPKASWASLNAPARNRTTEMHENITSRFANKALGSGLVLGRRTSTSAVTHHVSNCRENFVAHDIPELSWARGHGASYGNLQMICSSLGRRYRPPPNGVESSTHSTTC